MAEAKYRVQALPPTLGIKDPDVRNFLDALTNAWDHRSGNTDSASPDRFITAGEFKEMATTALVQALGESIPGENGGAGGSAVTDAINSVGDYIKKSILYQILGTKYPDIDISGLRAQVNAAFDGANTLIMQERQQRASADQAMTSIIEIQASRIQSAEAAIVAESSTRANKDNALASAINTMWAKIGGNTAVIQDGQLAAVTPNAAQATKWDQVQVAVRDPNTGQTSATSIKQELISYASLNDGTLNSLYTVRAQVTADGKTVVGGFGLAATNGAGSAQGPRISFGVRADEFFVASISGAIEATPFIVLTTPTVINGATRPPGIYITDAFIGNAAVDTLRIKGNAVTVPLFASSSSNSTTTSSQYLEAGSLVIAIASADVTCMGFHGAGIQLTLNGVGASFGGNSFTNFGTVVLQAGFIVPSSGNYSLSALAYQTDTDTSQPFVVRGIAISAFGGRR